jgi:large subunit ribosomal protein L1
VASGRIQATLFLSTPSLVKVISQRLGRVLGPRGLMPSERRGTVTDDVAGYIRRLQGTTEWKGDKRGTIRTPIAKVSLHHVGFDMMSHRHHFSWITQLMMSLRTFVTLSMLLNVRLGINLNPRTKTKARSLVRDMNLVVDAMLIVTSVNAINKVIISSRQGPGIQIADL